MIWKIKSKQINKTKLLPPGCWPVRSQNMSGCCSLFVSKLFFQIGLLFTLCRRRCCAFRVTRPVFSLREAGEPREQPRGSSWRGPGQICLGEDGFAGPGGAPGSGEGRLLRQRKLGQSRQWRAGVLQIADGEGRRKRLRPSRKLCLLRLWGQLPAHSRCGSRWHTVHQANSATFASFSQHDLVGRPFRRSSLGQGEAEGDDGEGRRKGRGLAPRCPVGCLGAAPGSFSFSWIAG